ncbi:MAG: hypothetical protein AB7E84_00265 [Xanthobacteraceae bacterium]
MSITVPQIVRKIADNLEQYMPNILADARVKLSKTGLSEHEIKYNLHLHELRVYENALCTAFSGMFEVLGQDSTVGVLVNDELDHASSTKH